MEIQKWALSGKLGKTLMLLSKHFERKNLYVEIAKGDGIVKALE